MENIEFLKSLAVRTSSKIVLLVIDGAGGIQKDGKTEIEKARTPNLDKIAKEGSCGIMDPVFPGITPGSGPGHLALFGYDPVKYQVGRGVLSALGIMFPLRKGDLAARINFATVDKEGKVKDRRAGRIPTSLNEKLCKKIESNVKVSGAEIFVRPVKEHRAALIVRGENLSDKLPDTDPQKEGVLPVEVTPLSREAEKTSKIIKEFIFQVRRVLSSEDKANMILLRGFSLFPQIPSLRELYKLNPACIAVYPMYKGVSRLVGMEILSTGDEIENEIKTLKENFNSYDFFFLHVKKTDSAGEDGDFSRKVKIIEKVDSIIPEILSLNPDVFAVTADHSTPSLLKSHSWHAVPVVIRAKSVRRDNVEKFTELDCSKGILGRFQSRFLMSLLLAHALKLKKFGA